MPANIARPSKTALVTSSLLAISSGDMSKRRFLSDIDTALVGNQFDRGPGGPVRSAQKIVWPVDHCCGVSIKRLKNSEYYSNK
jgi:hypothetical protein